MIETVLRLTLDLGIALLVITCGVPEEDMAKNIDVEPIRIACSVANGDETFVFAGKVFKVTDADLDNSGMWQ